MFVLSGIRINRSHLHALYRLGELNLVLLNRYFALSVFLLTSLIYKSTLLSLLILTEINLVGILCLLIRICICKLLIRKQI